MGKFLFLILFVFCASFAVSGKPVNFNNGQSVLATDHKLQHAFTYSSGRSDTTIHYKRKHKLWAFLLAIPPLGLLGLHRIYLGTSAAIPFLYIASGGGLLGILPFVDFVLIVLCKDVNAYAHKSTIFMWKKTDK